MKEQVVAGAEGLPLLFVDPFLVALREVDAPRFGSVVPFLNVRQHNSALSKLGLGCLSTGKLSVALFLLDRRCRIDTATGKDFLTRSVALRRLGHVTAANANLAQAQRTDPADLLLLRHLTAQASDATERERLSRLVLNDAAATDYDLATALANVLSIRVPLVLQFWRSGSVASGWMAWIGDNIPILEGAGQLENMRAEEHRWLSTDARIAALRFECDPREDVTIRAHINGIDRWLSVLPSPLPIARTQRRATETASVDHLTIIVPVYRDLDATRLCLESLLAQRLSCPMNIVVVDDNSPEPSLSSYVADFCMRHHSRLIVNEFNVGFTAAVNKALATCEPGDVLLLNSDVILEPSSIDRLMLVAHTSPTIGTVAPLSNDSATTSFPISETSSPLATASQRQELSDVAWSVHGTASLDVIANIGFCMYVKQTCLDAVGLLNPIYGKGYYEDIEFCLRGAELGYRNVAAVGVYVGHASGRSFQAERSALASRNLALLLNRFPNYSIQCAVSLQANPLKEAFGKIEERLPPKEPVMLLVGRKSAVTSMFDQQDPGPIETLPRVLHLCWTGGRDEFIVHVKARDGGVPQSVTFRSDSAGLLQLRSYVRQLRVERIEFVEARAVPEALLTILSESYAPLVLLVGSRSSACEAVALTSGLVADPDGPSGIDRWSSGMKRASPCFGRDSWCVLKPRLFVKAVDGMSQAFLSNGRVASPSTKMAKVPARTAASSSSAYRVIGIFSPQPHTAVDMLVLKLSRATMGWLALFVLGSCVDDLQMMASGNVFVTGPIEREDYSDVCGQHAIDALFSPYRTSMFARFSAAAGQTTLTRGFFDWTGGLFMGRSSDLILDADATDDDVCSTFLNWCRQGSATSGA